MVSGELDELKTDLSDIQVIVDGLSRQQSNKVGNDKSLEIMTVSFSISNLHLHPKNSNMLILKIESKSQMFNKWNLIWNWNHASL